MKTKEKLSNFFSTIKGIIKGADVFLILVVFSLTIGWYMSASSSAEKFEMMRNQQKELLEFKLKSIETMGYQSTIIDSQNGTLRNQMQHIHSLKSVIMQLMQELNKQKTKPKPKPGFEDIA